MPGSTGLSECTADVLQLLIQGRSPRPCPSPRNSAIRSQSVGTSCQWLFSSDTLKRWRSTRHGSTQFRTEGSTGRSSVGAAVISEISSCCASKFSDPYLALSCFMTGTNHVPDRCSFLFAPQLPLTRLMSRFARAFQSGAPTAENVPRSGAARLRNDSGTVQTHRT